MLLEKKLYSLLSFDFILGAYFLINYNPNNFIEEKFSGEFKRDIVKLNSTFEKHQLSYYMSKLLNGKIQVVLASDAKYVDEISDIANTIHSLLNSCKLLLITNIIIIAYYHIHSDNQTS